MSGIGSERIARFYQLSANLVQIEYREIAIDCNSGPAFLRGFPCPTV